MELVHNGKLLKVAYTYRVEVMRKADVEAVKELAASYGAGFRKGKAHGNLGNYRVDCFVEAIDWFVPIDRMMDAVQRVLPDARVYRGGMMEVEVIG